MDMDSLFERFRWHYENGAQDVLYPPRFDADESHSRRAYQLARAELEAVEAGVTFSWEDDFEADHVQQFDCYDEEPKTCEFVQMWWQDNMLGGLGCVDDATPAYRRIVEAELADEWRRGGSRLVPAAYPSYEDVA